MNIKCYEFVRITFSLKIYRKTNKKLINMFNNFKKKIKELQEKTSSIEAKNICKELLENFVNVSDSQITTVIVEKLKHVSDSDKHVEKFVKLCEKAESLTNLGVAKSVSVVKESQIYSYPGLRYGLEKIENALISAQKP